MCIFATAQSYAISTYIALPLPNVDECKSNKPRYYEASLLVSKVQNTEKLSQTLKKLFTKNNVELEKITTKGGTKRTVKFLKIANISVDSLDVSSAVQVGKYIILPFELPKKTRLRAGMNALVFEEKDGELLYNPSFSDPLISLIATSNFKNPTGEIDQKFFDENDKKICDSLIEKKLPILCFKNGVLVSEAVVNGVDDIEVAKFYRNAQDIFYSWKLDEYANFMTPYSREKFNSQFKSMSEDERKKVLGEYFLWKKKYHKVLDAGDEMLILFSRHKPQCEPYDDTAYISVKDGKFAITKFGAEKSPLDLFLSKYIYPKDGYLKLISKRYEK